MQPIAQKHIPLFAKNQANKAVSDYNSEDIIPIFISATSLPKSLPFNHCAGNFPS